MTTSLKALVFVAASFAFAASLGAAPAKSIRDSDIVAEQNQSSARITDASSDMQLASKAYGNKTYKYAWIYLTDCGVKLDQTKSQLKDEPARIQVAKNFLGFTITQSTRKTYSDKYYKIKGDLDHAFMLMNALEADLGKELGVDVAAVRKYMSALQILCDQTKEPKYCEAYARLKALVDSGDIAGMASAIQELRPLMEQAQQDAAKAGISVEIPPASTVIAKSAAGSYATPAIQSLYAQWQKDCDNGNKNACERIQLLKALDAAVSSGDASAKNQLEAIAKLDTACRPGADHYSCD